MVDFRIMLETAPTGGAKELRHTECAYYYGLGYYKTVGVYTQDKKGRS